jgi:uncharacterized protein
MELHEMIRVNVKNIIDSGMHFNAATVATDIGKSLGVDEETIKYIHIEIRNAMYEEQYKKIPIKDRMIFLPHCSRNSQKCIATQDDTGLHCKHCGKCELTKAIKIAEKYGYEHIYIVPGGTMLKKIIMEKRPKAVIGVACFYEINLGFDLLKGTGMIAQGVLLKKDGCKDTVLNLEEFEKRISMIDKPKEETTTKKVKKTKK